LPAPSSTLFPYTTLFRSLFSPRIGFVNQSLQSVLNLPQAPIDIYSLGGMIFLEGLRLVPTGFLMLVPLMRSMDPSLEEAAAVSRSEEHTSELQSLAYLVC